MLTNMRAHVLSWTVASAHNATNDARLPVDSTFDEIRAVAGDLDAGPRTVSDGHA